MYQFKGRIMIYFSLLFVLEYNSAITIKENINLGNLGNNSGTYISEGNNNWHINLGKVLVGVNK